MRGERIRFLLLACVVVTVFIISVTPTARLQSRGLTAEEQRGRQIYLRGVNAAGQDIVATMSTTTGNSTAGSGSSPATEMPAAYLACVSCHGRDGAGKPEGGIRPSNITWEALTKPYSVTTASGRTHPAYDKQFLKRAITLGIDPAGNTLQTMMPRYRLSQQDAEDLIAYLKVLGKQPDPGLSDATIRIGMTVITEGPFAEMSQAVRASLAAYFDTINQQGGVFNRRIELQTITSADGAEPRIKALRAAIDNDDNGQPFALVSVFMAGAEEEFATLSKERAVPLIGAITLSPPIGVPPNPFVFYLSAGLKDQSRALTIFAADKYASEKPGAAIIYTDDAPTREAVKAIHQQSAKAGLSGIEEIRVRSSQFSPEQLVRSLTGKATQIVFLLVPADLQDAILEQAEKLNWRATYLIPGLLAGRKVMEVSERAADQVFLSVSSLPSDQTVEGLTEYRRLAELYKLPGGHAASQIQAIAAAKTLVEGLKRVGRDLSRQKLIDALEGLYQFKTGLMPPITYNPNRRIGAAGAYIVTIEKTQHRLIPVSKWIEVE